jgi:hypothetical protein
MPGLGPGIHDLRAHQDQVVDGRARPGHDEWWGVGAKKKDPVSRALLIS